MDSMGALLPGEVSTHGEVEPTALPTGGIVSGVPGADQRRAAAPSPLALLPWLAAPLAVLFDARGTFLLAALVVALCAAALAWRGRHRALRATLATGALGIGLLWLGGLERSQAELIADGGNLTLWLDDGQIEVEQQAGLAGVRARIRAAAPELPGAAAADRDAAYLRAGAVPGAQRPDRVRGYAKQGAGQPGGRVARGAQGPAAVVPTAGPPGGTSDG